MKTLEEETLLPIEGVDFEFVEISEEVSKDSKNPATKLLTGPWSGIVIQYGQIQIEYKDDPLEAPVMRFDWRILEDVGHDRKALRENRVFRDYIGDIITSCVVEYVKERESGSRGPNHQGSDNE